jgi:hypothetical protein
VTDYVSAAAQILAAVGGAGGLGAWLRWSNDRRKQKHESAQRDITATKVITDTAVGLLKPLQDQITAMSEELTKSRAEAVALRDDVRGLHDWIQLLIDALEAHDIPVPARPAPPQPSPASARRRPRRDRREPEGD